MVSTTNVKIERVEEKIFNPLLHCVKASTYYSSCSCFIASNFCYHCYQLWRMISRIFDILYVFATSKKLRLEIFCKSMILEMWNWFFTLWKIQEFTFTHCIVGKNFVKAPVIRKRLISRNIFSVRKKNSTARSDSLKLRRLTGSSKTLQNPLENLCC